MIQDTIYGVRPSVLLEAAVHILRDDVPRAKAVVQGDVLDFPGVEQILNPGASTNYDEAVLAWLEGKNTFVPHNIDHFFDRVFLQMNLGSPEGLTFLGFLDQAGIKGHHGCLDDSPSEQHEQTLELTNDYVLSAVRDASKWGTMTSDQQDSLKILKWSTENCNRNFRDHVIGGSLAFGIHLLFIALMTSYATVEDINDVQLYESRLKAAKKRFTLAAADLRNKRNLGVVSPHHNLVKQCAKVSNIESRLQNMENNFLIESVKSKFQSATSKKLPDEWEQKLSKAITNYVIPGYKVLLNELKACVEFHSDDNGLWSLPRGDAFYRHCLKWHTTTELSPEYIHNLGLEKVNELHNEVQRVIRGMNDRGDTLLDASRTVSENLASLCQNPCFLYADTESGKSECLQEYERIFCEISEKVKNLFDLVPSGTCNIEAMSRSMSQSPAFAYYSNPSMDLTRSGTFYVNLGKIKSQNRSQAKTLTVHESVPGHHYQISLQIENKKLPYFRRYRARQFAAFVEGWGLYAEHLANEIGFFKDEDGNEGYSVLGYCYMELLRSSRLVVDTGLHVMKWTRKQAVEYMIDSTGMPTETAEDEVMRYLAAPGQACAYKIGQLKLLELREKLQKEQGLDIRAFHRKVLQLGAVPLHILEEILLSDKK